MAKLILQGEHSDVRLLSPGEGSNEEEELYRARCEKPGCQWTEVYDTLSDAREYAEDHADTGRSEH